MPLDQMVRYWKGKEKENESGVTEYIQTLRANMQMIRDLAYEKKVEEKVKQKQYSDLKTKDQTFAVGDFALIFRPTLRALPYYRNCYTSNLMSRCGGKGY